MAQTVGAGVRLVAAAAGGMVGLGIGLFLGFEVGAMIGGPSAGPGPSEAGRALGMVVGLVGGALLGAFLVGRPVVARWCFGTAFAVGGVSFLAGFVGPIVLTPDSPQGPLLGIFFTGPIGFVAGAVIGMGIGLTKERRQYA